MRDFNDLLEQSVQGSAPAKMVEMLAIGQDRVDDFRAEPDKEAAFQELVQKYAAALPYVDPSWVGTIATQLRAGESAQELAQMAAINRDEYAGSARIDSGGSFDTWEVIFKSLIALPTDALPPAPVPLQ